MMVRLLALVPLVIASTAQAQAPGEMVPGGPGATPPQAPPAPPAVQRWSIGAAFGGMGVSPKNAPDAEADFAIAEIALRYQIADHLGLELSLAGGRQRLGDGSDGDLAMESGTLAARYRFNPRACWNWWLMGGLGATAIASHTATDQEVHDATRPHGMLGVGVERRFERFALQLEARAIALGETKAEKMGVVPLPQGSMPAPSSGGLSGGLLTLGASYYF